MVKRTFQGIFLCILLMVLYVGYSMIFDGQEQIQKKVVIKRAAAPKVKPWDGVLSRTYTTTLIRRGQKVMVSSVDFSHLTTTRANVTIHLATQASSTAQPKWLISPSAFTGVTINAKRYYPNVRTKYQNGFWLTDVAFKKIPIGSLGDTCVAAQNDRLSLLIRGLGRPVAIQMIPPAPPAGHCFSSDPAVAKPKKKKKRRR